MVGVVSAVRDLARIREISLVLARHGFGEVVQRAGFGRRRKPDAKVDTDKSGPPSADTDIPAEEIEKGEKEKHQISFAERARLVLQDLGPSFIKLGQIASTRPDVLPADLVNELKKLQDDVPAVPFEEIKSEIEASLGAPLADLFVSFEEEPLATASIGQVHRAVLRLEDGSDADVVVKVQRPGVAQTVARDVELLHMMAAAIERAFPETRIYSPTALVQNFDRSISNELNFLVEADHAERFIENFKDNEDVAFPKVYRQASSKHVLTLEYFDGWKIEEALAAGIDGPKLAKKSTALVIKMIFEDGFFHADPHPGNIIILGPVSSPKVGLIDLGMVGRLSPELRDLTVDLMVAAVRKDTVAVADVLYRIGRPTKKIDMREYRAEVAFLAEKYLGKPLKEIEMSLLIRDLVQGAMKYGLEISPDFMLVGKSLMTMEGIGRQLDPDLDVFGEAQPHFYEILRQRYSPERLGNELWRGVEQLSRVSYDLPMQAREVLEDLRLGRLVVKVRDPELPRASDRMARRLFVAIVIASLFGSAAILLRGGDRDVIAIVMLVFALFVWVGHAALDLRRGPKA